MDNNQKPQGQQLSVELRPDIAAGTYSNLAIISHSHSEFVIDFASTLPPRGKAVVQSRIIMAPEHAKRLLQALSENISKYESHFGPIDLGGATLNVEDFLNGTKS